MISEAVALELVRQVPALCVVAWLVYEKGKQAREMSQLFAGSIKDLAADCHSHHARAADALIKNAEASATLAESIRRCHEG